MTLHPLVHGLRRKNLVSLIFNVSNAVCWSSAHFHVVLTLIVTSVDVLMWQILIQNVGNKIQHQVIVVIPLRWLAPPCPG